MGCKGPGTDAVAPEHGSGLCIACFSVDLYCKAGEENKDVYKGELEY